jgi:Cft2 family RNA processing exonuclease
MVRRKGLEVLKNRRVGVVTGWALDRSAIYRYGCDEAFALSDHADYGELIEMVEKVKPKEIRTVHGYAQEFAMDLQERGWKAWALAGETQLVLPLGGLGTGEEAKGKSRRRRIN